MTDFTVVVGLPLFVEKDVSGYRQRGFKKHDCFSAVARTLTQLYDHVLKDTGLEAPQFALLLTIEKLGPSSQVLLGRRFGMDKTTVSRNVRWLEQRGWVQSRIGTSENNRHARFYSLTATGRHQLKQETEDWVRTSGIINRILRTNE